MSEFKIKKDGKTMQQGDISQMPPKYIRDQMREAGYVIHKNEQVFEERQRKKNTKEDKK